MTEFFDDKDDAIKAALDQLEEGGTLVVHEDYCAIGFADECTCNPQTWTYDE